LNLTLPASSTTHAQPSFDLQNADERKQYDEGLQSLLLMES
jgi:hypothetical protein